MQPRDVLALVGRAHHLRDDLVERHRRGIEDARAGRAIVEQRLRHQRARIKTDRAAAIRSRPRTVMRSGAPGPAPMK